MYFGNNGKQSRDIDTLFGSQKFGLTPDIAHLHETANRIFRNRLIPSQFDQKLFLKTATDVIAIEKSLAYRMKARWADHAVGKESPWSE